MRPSRLIALAVLLPLAAGAQNPAAIEHHLRYGVKITEQPDMALELLDRMRSYHVPAVSIAVIDNFRVVFAKGYGVTEFGGSKPVDSTTLFLAGSISKPIFTSGFLRLLNDRKISLDTNVNALLTTWHLPESRFTEREKVTLRRLLTHTAGLTVWGFPGYALDKPVPTVPQLPDGVPPAGVLKVSVIEPIVVPLKLPGGGHVRQYPLLTCISGIVAVLPTSVPDAVAHVGLPFAPG